MNKLLLIRAAAWLSLAAVIFVTVCPIEYRPHDIIDVDVDRAMAFMVMGILFVTGYPRRVVLCAVLLVIGAFALETLQFLSPTRHAHFEDAATKSMGALFGVFLAEVVNRIRGIRHKAG